jgi:hypothetical protein
MLGRGRARIYNLISLIFLILSIIVVIIVISQFVRG